MFFRGQIPGAPASTWRCLILLAAGLVAVNNTRADLPFPQLHRLQPLGIAAGGALEFEILGADLEGPLNLRFSHPGIKAEPVPMKERFFKISVTGETPEGVYDVWLDGKYGVSSPRLLAVSRGLADVAEKEPNNDRAAAQAVSVNSAVNGMSDGNDQDVFRLTLKQGQRIVVDCQAQKLDSQLDGNLTITSSSGAQLASNGDYHGRDPLLDFLAPADGDYFVTVSDLSYRGGLPYRLLISDRPHVENVFPRAIQLGKAAELTLWGRNLGRDAKPSTLSLFDLPLDEARQTITAPADPQLLGQDATRNSMGKMPMPLAALGNFRFLEHPADCSVLPTAATCTLSGFQFRPQIARDADAASPLNQSLSALSLVLVDTPVTLEQEPNDKVDAPQALTLPAVVSGRFDAPRDADWYEFQSGEAGRYGLEVYCERIAGQADPYVVLMDDKGARVIEMDDFGHRINAFDGHLRDPSGVLDLAANQKYRLLVQDRYRRGGARYSYVLSLRKAQPDFFAAAIHHQTQTPAGTTIWRGGAACLDIVIHQRDGLSDPVTITAAGLPPGVHAAETTISLNTLGLLVLWADENAPEFTGPIQLIATSKIGDKVLKREVRPYTKVFNDGNSSRPMQEMVIAVREKAPFQLQFEPEKVQIEAGRKTNVKLKLTRLWPGFKEKLTLLPQGLPGNIHFSTPEIPAGANEATLEIDVQAGTPPLNFTITVIGQGQVPYNKDAAAKEQPPTLVSLPSLPLQITVTAPPKK